MSAQRGRRLTYDYLVSFALIKLHYWVNPWLVLAVHRGLMPVLIRLMCYDWLSRLVLYSHVKHGQMRELDGGQGQSFRLDAEPRTKNGLWSEAEARTSKRRPMLQGQNRGQNLGLAALKSLVLCVLLYCAVIKEISKSF